MQLDLLLNQILQLEIHLTGLIEVYNLKYKQLMQLKITL